MNKFRSIQEPPVQPASYSDRQFMHTFLAGALLPLVQSTITAFVLMIATAVVLYMFDAIDFIKPILVVGGLSWVVMWLYLQRRWLTLTALERALQVDLDGDRHIGKPEPKRETIVRVDKISRDKTFQQSRYTFSIADDKLMTFACGMVEGKPISRRRWTVREPVFSDGEYRAFQSELIKWQLIEPGGNGFVLTEAGEDFFESYVDQNHLPSPTPTVGITKAP